MPIAKKGVLDLKNWDFVNNGNVKLNGQWEFYWQKLYKPDHFKTTSTVKPNYIKVPLVWNKHHIDSIKNALNGYATYLEKKNLIINFRLRLF